MNATALHTSGQDHKALNFHIYFRASDRTLINEEVDREVGKITRALDRDFRTTLRN